MKFLRYTVVLFVMLWGLRGMAYAEEQKPLVVGVIDQGFSYSESVSAWYADSYELPSVPLPKGHGARVVNEMIYHWESHGITAENTEVRILPVSFAIETPRYSERLVEAIDQAVEGGAEVISISSGVPYFSRSLYTSMLKYHQQGIVFVAAAGNDPSSYALYPARFRFVVGVGWMDAVSGTIRGPRGGVSLVVRQEDMHQPQGSSFAAPLVASLIALQYEECYRNSREWISGVVDLHPELSPLVQGAGVFRYDRYPTYAEPIVSAIESTNVHIEDQQDVPVKVSFDEFEDATPEEQEDVPQLESEEQPTTTGDELADEVVPTEDSTHELPVVSPVRPAFFSSLKEALEYYQQRHLEVIPMTQKEG